MVQVGAELVFRVLGCKSKRITVTHKKTLVCCLFNLFFCSLAFKLMKEIRKKSRSLVGNISEIVSGHILLYYSNQESKFAVYDIASVVQFLPTD